MHLFLIVYQSFKSRKNIKTDVFLILVSIFATPPSPLYKKKYISLLLTIYKCILFQYLIIYHDKNLLLATTSLSVLW